jgi:toxin HigB-1
MNRRLTNRKRTARRKLLYLEEAEHLQDLRSPPGNRLELLRGDRAGQYSIRINEQWRICFYWEARRVSSDEEPTTPLIRCNRPKLSCYA